MLHVKDESGKKPVTSTSTSLDMYSSTTPVVTNLVNCDLLGDFSLLSQEEFQECESLLPLSKRICHKDDESSAYHQTNDGFEKALDMVTTKEDVDEINMFFLTLLIKEYPLEKDTIRLLGILFYLGKI